MKDTYPHCIIAREGWTFIALAIIVTFFVQWAWGILAALPLWFMVWFIINFFRDPARTIPDETGIALCPADGRIVAVENTLDPYRKKRALKISIFMNVFNVHTNRAAVAGIVNRIAYHKGSFFNAALAKSSLENERNAVLIDMADGTEVTLVQIAGLIARRIFCYVNPGDMITAGQRYGFIRFGSRVDVYLPTTAKSRVSIGEKVKATETILASF